MIYHVVIEELGQISVSSFDILHNVLEVFLLTNQIYSHLVL